MSTVITIIIAAVLTNNFVLSKFYGCCPFLGVSKKLDSSIGMGAAVVFVMVCAALVTYPIYYFLLEPNDLTYLRTVAFILVIAVFVQLLEMIIKKMMPPLYKTLGVYLPLITTNCAVLGVALTNVQKEYGIFTGTVNGFAAAFGFSISIVLMAGIREKIAYNDIPESFKGMPMVLVTAGLMAIAFCGFSGLL